MAVARAYLAVLAACIVGAMISGVLVEQHLWTPLAAPDLHAYNDVFSAHAWFPFAALLPAVLAAVFGARDGARVHVLAWLGFVLWGAAIVVTLWILIAPGAAWAAAVDARGTVVAVLAAASGLCAIVPLWIARRGDAMAMVLIVLLGLACVLALGAAPAASAPFVILAALAVALEAVRAGRGLPCVIYAGGALIAALAYAAVGMVIHLGVTDVHLRDTYAITGAIHLLVVSGVFALLALLHARGDLLGRVPHAAVATIGAALMCLGAFAMISAMMTLGMHGMPMRYASYTPQFADGHHAVAIGGGVLTLGLVVVALAWLLGRRYVARDASVHAHS